MPPAPNREHQDLEWALETWLRQFWAPVSQGKVYHQINVAAVGGWPTDFRIPDVVLLTPDRFEIDRNEYFEGAPSVVIEIKSQDDETYDKFDFYAAIGVPEIWVIDRDTRQPEIYRWTDSGYLPSAAESGWCSSRFGVQLSVDLDQRQLLIRCAEDESSTRAVPST